MKSSFYSSPSGEKSRVQLPKINETRISNAEDSEYYDNPFYVPADEEIFKMQSKGKENKEQERKHIQSLKVWEKGVKHANSAGKLRRIMELTNFKDDSDEEYEGKLNIVDAAKSAIKNRVRHKESLVSFLGKKKDMFLFQMTINEKKEQIKEFEELAHLQEISLQNSKDFLEKDAEVFKQHIEKSKNETRQAIKNAEKETKEKQKRIQEMRQIQDDLSSTMSKNTKQLERLEKLYTYKLFLDDLTPEEFKNHQAKMKQERQSQSEPAELLEEPLKSDKSKGKFNWLKFNNNLSPGIIKFLNDDQDEFEMYFNKPDQLQEYFDDLEERNLFIIKNTQDIEQSLEDFKHNFEKKKNTLLERERQLTNNKQELEKVIEGRLKNITQLSHVRSDRFTEKILDKLENVIKTIYDTRLSKEGRGDLPSNISGFELLRLIERRLDLQLNQLKQFNPQKGAEQYKFCVARRREENKLIKEKEQQEEDRIKSEKVKKRLMAEKRFGRPIMGRSMQFKEIKQEAQVNDIDEAEIDKRLYYTVRFNN